MSSPYTIHLISCSIEESYLSFPLGALTIASALIEQSDIQAKISCSQAHYYCSSSDPIEVAKETARLGYDCVGISLYLYNREWFDQFISAFTPLASQTLLFAGGPEATVNWKELLLCGVDVVTLGEGEDPTIHMVRQLLAGENVQGVGIATHLQDTPSMAYVEDLTTYRSPLLSYPSMISSYRGILWEIARGCPYRCAFCFESRGKRGVRRYPIDRIEKEFHLLVERGISHVFVLDPTFNMDRAEAIGILEFLIQHAPPSMHFTFEVRAELIDPYMAHLFGNLYCSLQIGLQSSNCASLHLVNRQFDQQVFSSHIELLNEHNVVFGLDLIIGLPEDTLSSFFESLDFALWCKPSNIDIFLLSLLPGTELAQKASSLGLIHQEKSPYELRKSPTMSEEDIAYALHVKDLCDSIYTQGNAVMWFSLACKALKMRPTEFLLACQPFMERSEDICEVQDLCVEQMCVQQGKEYLYRALSSYIELHQGIGFFQETGESPIIHLYYDPNDVSKLDDLDIDLFVETHESFSEKKPYTIWMEDETLYIENYET